MLIESGVVKKVVEEEVAGKCEITSAENFLKKF
jgi:peroxiredoxin